MVAVFEIDHMPAKDLKKMREDLRWQALRKTAGRHKHG